MEAERTLVLIKPDGLARQIVGQIITRFENAGLKLVAMKLLQAPAETTEKHYREEIAEKYGQRVRDDLLTYIREGPIISLVLEGIDAINVTRKMVGSTYPNESSAGTIRGDFTHISKDFANANEVSVRNLIHASSDSEDAKLEIGLWFDENEIHSYETVHDLISLRKRK